MTLQCLNLCRSRMDPGLPSSQGSPLQHFPWSGSSIHPKAALPEQQGLESRVLSEQTCVASTLSWLSGDMALPLSEQTE